MQVSFIMKTLRTQKGVSLVLNAKATDLVSKSDFMHALKSPADPDRSRGARFDLMRPCSDRLKRVMLVCTHSCLSVILLT